MALNRMCPPLEKRFGASLHRYLPSLVLQLSLLFGGALLYILLTCFSYRGACVCFEKIDL